MAKETKKAAKARSDALVLECKIMQDTYYRKYDLQMTPEEIEAECGISADRVRAHESGNFDKELSDELPKIWQRRRGIL